MTPRLVPEPAHGMLFLRLVGGTNNAASAPGRVLGVIPTPRPQPQVSQ
ncbi:uncharacterized protein METZ01_LOCUS42231 [marine metagenome]|uniref:Uncharacterized protein n=1 Tax=marine metagenome TaxID=408172 RepID=A0A381RHM3_9ZZZZ